MWGSPKCGRSFKNTNQSHDCGENEVRSLLGVGNQFLQHPFLLNYFSFTVIYFCFRVWFMTERKDFISGTYAVDSLRHKWIAEMLFAKLHQTVIGVE